MTRYAETIEELAENPEKFGFVTAEEWSRNYEKKYKVRDDEELEAIDRGDPLLGCKQRYYMEGLGGRYSLDSLAQFQRIANDMGLDWRHDFAVDPQLRPDGAAGFYNEVTFRAKRDLAERARW